MSKLKKNNSYFASDFHLGAPNFQESLEREKKIVDWLTSIQDQASDIYLVGDIFDFWFEYKKAIPKGFIRFQGKIAELTDSGVNVHFFLGNHDMWMFDYFEKELGVLIHRAPLLKKIGNHQFYITHGDGLGPGDNYYKFLKKIFNNRFFQWCFARVHPNLGIRIANYCSKTSRKKSSLEEEKYLGDDKEWLLLYAKDLLTKKPIDYFVFGHRHLPIQKKLGGKSMYFNLGDWLYFNTFGVYDGDHFKLLTYPDNELFFNSSKN